MRGGVRRLGGGTSATINVRPTLHLACPAFHQKREIFVIWRRTCARLAEARHAVDKTTAEEFSGQLKIELRELVNNVEFKKCPSCGKEKRPGTIVCSSGKIMPDTKQGIEHQVLQATPQHIDKMLTLKNVQ